MLNTSGDYSPDQRGEFHGTLTPRGSEGVTVTDGDIVLESVTLTENCCDRKFGFGAFIAAQLDMTLKLGGEHDLRAPLLTGAQIELSRRFFDDADTQTDELPLGHFFIDDASVKRTKTSAAFTAYDAAVWFDRPVTADPEDVADLTPYELIDYARICVNARLLAVFGAGYSVTMAQTAGDIANFPNAGRRFSWLHTSEEQLTYRDMVGAALGIMGAWGRINRYGQLEIHRFDLTSAVYTIDGSNAARRSISDSAARITGVKCGDITFGSDVQQYDISANLLMNSVTGQAVGDVVSALGSSASVTGFGIYTAEISWFGDLALEAGDCIAYVQDGVAASIIAMETVWKPHGLCTVRAFGVNSEKGSTTREDSMGAVVGSTSEVPYIKSNIVLPEINKLDYHISKNLLGGAKILPTTIEAYETMPEHDPETLYIVTSEDPQTGEEKAELYMGDTHITTEGGGGDDGIPYPGEMIMVVDAVPDGFVGTAQADYMQVSISWEEGGYTTETVDDHTYIVPQVSTTTQRTGAVSPSESYLHFVLETSQTTYTVWTCFCEDANGYYLGTIYGTCKMQGVDLLSAANRWSTFLSLPAGTEWIYFVMSKADSDPVRSESLYYME